MNRGETHPVFNIRIMDLRTNTIITIKREWKMFRGHFYPTLGYIGGLFSTLEEKFKGQFQFTKTPYSKFLDDEERVNTVLYSLQPSKIM